jgi:hypothetical protein
VSTLGCMLVNAASGNAGTRANWSMGAWSSRFGDRVASRLGDVHQHQRKPTRVQLPYGLVFSESPSLVIVRVSVSAFGWRVLTRASLRRRETRPPCIVRPAYPARQKNKSPNAVSLWLSCRLLRSR